MLPVILLPRSRYCFRYCSRYGMSRGGVRLLGGVMVAVFVKYPHLLDESPGLGDLKTAPHRQGEYVSYSYVLTLRRARGVGQDVEHCV